MKKDRLSIAGIILLAIPAFATAYLSSLPRYTFRNADRSELMLTFKHTSHRVHECAAVEKATYIAGIHNLKHSQNAGALCGGRERHPVGIRLVMDGKVMVNKDIPPLGWRHDSTVFVFEKFIVPPGEHSLVMAMRDSGKTGENYDFRYEGIARFEQGKIVVVDFDDGGFKVAF